MSVYVDASRMRYGRMVMCHMLADSKRELNAMADKIGVARKWLQHPENPGRMHYDICLAKRKLAVVLGAIEADRTMIAEVMKRNSMKHLEKQKFRFSGTGQFNLAHSVNTKARIAGALPAPSP